MNDQARPRSQKSHQYQSVDNDEIDLRDLIRVLWLQRLIIVGIAVIGALLGVGASLMSARYVSEGLFMTTVSMDAYKRYESVLFNGPRLQQFLQQSSKEGSPAGQHLLKLVDNPLSLSRALKPEFSFTDKDAKAFGLKADQTSALIGIRLRNEERTPTGAAPVLLLAEYIRDTMIRVDMDATMLAQCNHYRTREQTLRNDQIQSEFDIKQQQHRVQTLKDLIARRPDSTLSDSRQIVAVEKGAERFLSPVAQLTAVEILIADMKLAEARRERELIGSALKRDYYCEAQKALQGPLSGRAFLAALSSIQANVFTGADKSIGIVEQTWNELDLQRANWINSYLASMRFVVSPEGSEFRESRPGLVTGLILGLVAGGLLGVLLAFVIGWWRASHEVIAAPQRA